MKPLSSMLALAIGLSAFAGSAGAGPSQAGFAAPQGHGRSAAAAVHGPRHGRPHGHHHGHRGLYFAGPFVMPQAMQQAPLAAAPEPAPAPPVIVVAAQERPRCFEPRIILLKPVRPKHPAPWVHYGRPKGC